MTVLLGVLWINDLFHDGVGGLDIYCFRKSKRITREILCRRCLFRRRCRPFQLWLQPELPFVFKSNGDVNAIFDLQNNVQNTLDALFPSEYRLLEKKALKALTCDGETSQTLIRLKMFELFNNIGS
ncbi:hypothetical protein SAMN02746065_103233 [Desulfocicer vacuolatum DSM 3385]|uniref:Uncharacterized protein n=1 Tax=Desulfocicer vacuolatum DSM 3385 TaxID=1121400 RepID=A0A1W1ZW63_9BACT|nr:hypothetical protein [Desulfocicer vacuolatum]SMC52654.1 hypothetical protein SAMN02746065_103233 [Desulfocicer vacuolatum DSM 3385]